MNIKIAVLFGLVLALANGATFEDFARGNNVFAAHLYSKLVLNNKGNILVSPFSAEIVLALSQSGARNETAEEIRTALHLPNTDEEVRSIFKNVLPALKSEKKISLHTANKIYINSSLTLKEQFKKVGNEVYRSDVENINFSQKEQAADTMNTWVENQTENKIQNLISPDILTDKTALILVNALHFKGQWNVGFGSQFTRKFNFYKTSQEVIQVDTMFCPKMDANYYSDTELDAKFLELPFLGEDISMVFALPNNKDGITTLESQIEKVLAPHSFYETEVHVSIPKFRIENSIDLKEILQNLGVKKAFTREADFSGLVHETENLSIDNILQKSFIDVDEKGVEAASATFVEVFAISGPSEVFVADHPFIFYIKFKNVILFAGKVASPGQ